LLLKSPSLMNIGIKLFIYGMTFASPLLRPTKER